MLTSDSASVPLLLLAAARQTMYSSIYYLVVSGSEAAIRLPVRKSVSADLTTSRASQVVKDGCRLRYFTSRLDVASSPWLRVETCKLSFLLI